ncbi:disease resistance protein RUN1-like [Citrus sinensis]|uniref:disease resistance protein RUN1-like n=1 Tax=Citrus sinensis TaxID=2711 RepID=UPI0022799A0D|nr:disease resistance protein RUN1-like [Citrus sinensis]
MASSSSLHFQHNRNDVFLSFKGEDTRDNFTSHLYSALSQKCIETFIGNDLKRGDEISQSLGDAVEVSSIYIIFSESDASSSWCLDELLKIVECRTNYGQIVVAVCYRVEPSHVRKQIGSFEDSFSKLEERFPDKMQTGKKHICLDVAYFLKEERSDMVLSFLDACGFFAGIGLPVLVNRCLITVSHSNTITMHDSLGDMEREIVQKESINYPGECSPLWHHKDIYEVLIVNTHHCKLKHKSIGASSPSFIPPLNKLVILNLSEYVSLNSLPAEILHLEFLKKLNLLGCSKLKRLPEFSSSGKIEEIWLDGTAIEELPSSIGCLSRLLYLYLSDCKRLKSLPSSLSQLKSLKLLNLHGCSNLQRLPDDFGNLEASNSTLYAKGTAAKREVPSSIVGSNNNLYELSLDRSWGGDKQMGLSSPITLPLDGLHTTLTSLYLNYCGILELPDSLGQLCSL